MVSGTWNMAQESRKTELCSFCIEKKFQKYFLEKNFFQKGQKSTTKNFYDE